MAKICCVCRDIKEGPENRLFRCGGQGCGITVHQACYGIVNIPSGLWFCRKCESQERAARVKCDLCPRKDGALKRTNSGTWAHVVCALYIPEVTFGNLRTMEPIITSKLPRERFTKVCYICESQGLESQAATGACMSCHKSNCRLSFHVTCAQKEHLLVEEEDTRDSRNIIYCGYCATHFKRMMKQKMKQNLKKQQGGQSGMLLAGTVGGGGGGGGVAIGGIEPIDMPGGVGSGMSRPAQSQAHSQPQSHSQLQTQPPFIDQMMSPSPLHSVPSTTTATTTSSGGGGVAAAYHHNKHLNKTKDSDRLSKRSSSETGLMPSVRRKYRRRKLSSSNESSSSESPSVSSEHLQQNAPPKSPSLASLQSPESFCGGKKSGNEDVTDPDVQNSEMDCGNLNLLASVTQRVDKVDNKLINETEATPSPSPPVTSVSSTVSETAVCSRVSPVVPLVTTATTIASDPKEIGKRNVGGVGRGGGGNRKRKSTSSASVNPQVSTSNSSQLSPPMSLQELLERQWEQTAQFILDQAGKQNNAGVMLAHLHELQSENRAMQSRIMELASQREFFIATNSRLRQTLAGVTVTKAINGIQQQVLPPVVSGGGGDPPTLVNHDPQPVEVLHNQRARPTDHTPFGMNSSSGTISNNSSAPSNTIMNSSEPSSFGTSMIQDRGGSDPFLRHTHHPTSYSISYPSPTGSIVNPSGTPTPLLYSNEIPMPGSVHEVTHVTNSVQGPITTFTGFPNNSLYPTHQPLPPHAPPTTQYSHRHST